MVAFVHIHSAIPFSGRRYGFLGFGLSCKTTYTKSSTEQLITPAVRSSCLMGIPFPGAGVQEWGLDDKPSSEEELRRVAWKNAVAATIEDHIRTGRNICIGDGDTKLLIEMLDTIDVHLQTNNVLDIAFTATTPPNMRLLHNRELPTDLSVNYRANIDIYIAPVLAADPDYNVVLDGDDPAADCTAAHLAERAIFLIHEDALEATEKSGISTFPITLSSFLPKTVINQHLLTPSLISAGVDHIVLRKADGVVADVKLAPGAAIALIRDELRSMPFVQSVGLFAVSPNTTLIVAPRAGPAFDMTPPQTALSLMTDDGRHKPVDQARSAQAIDELPGWRILDGTFPALAVQFRFPDAGRAGTFVRHVQRTSQIARHYPEIRQNYSTVRICLSSPEACGITELDIMFARELTRVYKNLRAVHLARKTASG